MLTTEDDAKERWCPMQRFEGSTDEENDGCLADDCMMWRWHDEAKDSNGDPTTNRRGYCGIAGKPTAY